MPNNNKDHEVLSFSCHKVDDADVIAWVKSQDQRSKSIKHLIRNAGTTDIFQAFSDMRSYLDDKFSKIGSVAIQGGGVAQIEKQDEPQLTEEQVRQREDKIRKDTKKKW